MCDGLDTWKEQQLEVPLSSLGDEQQGRKRGYACRKATVFTIVAVITVTSLCSGLIATSAALAVITAKPCLEDVEGGWVGYQGLCYFFSENERNWTASQSHCLSHGASLAGIASDVEMTFLLRYKGSLYHWIGLRREPDQPWKWPNSTEFDNRFKVRGGGDCAYLNDVGVSASSCVTEKNWVCAKPDRYMKQKPLLSKQIVE
ncbi:C-type lectin domain family 2 member D-like [Emydura macquarii macquarii]|uniref:C-type lectin domain family 2 member D-like n=1 Tax=Emydura macquarii macquarii TaxID=1129001 RepID=UPI00352A427F